MPDEISAKLIVKDTGPLITLAAADCLDYLLKPGVDVFIADAVMYEATRDGDALGAAEILAWAQSNTNLVRTISTSVFFNFVESLSGNPARREKDLGERAAMEAIHDAIALGDNDRALLVTEDDRVLRRILVVETELTDRMIPVTTRDLLEALERAGRINSADEVYRRAEDAGRLASRRAALSAQHFRARDAVERMLKRPSQSET